MKYFTNRRYFLLVIFLGMGSTCIAQQKNVADDLQKIMKAYDAVGLSVVVVKQNAIVYSQAFGKKNIETDVDLKSDDLFRIASISKSFSSTAIMQLIEAGKCALDDDFSELVGFTVRNPAFPQTVITLRMVLSHTSSINDREGYFSLDAIDSSKNANWKKCYNDYEPGKGYEYCNLNYNMVGAVIEKLSGERFDLYIKNHILNPLGLYAGYNVNDLDTSRFASLYEYDAKSKTFAASPNAYAARTEAINNYQMGYSTPVFSPTGGMKISAPDLAKYMLMHMNDGKYKGKRIIQKKLAKTMRVPVAKEAGYGLAISTVNNLIADTSINGHTGSAYGLYSAMFFHPEKNYGFVVITNGCKPVYKDGRIALLEESMELLFDYFIK